MRQCVQSKGPQEKCFIGAGSAQRIRSNRQVHLEEYRMTWRSDLSRYLVKKKLQLGGISDMLDVGGASSGCMKC